VSVCLHDDPHRTNFHKTLYSSSFQKSVKKIQVPLKSDKNNTGTLHKDKYTFLIISRSVLLIMRNVSDKSCRGNPNTHFVFDNFFFNCAVCKIMWKNTAELDRPQITIQHMCLIYKSTNIYSEHEIFITFSLQQWLHEHASMLCYTYIACLVCTKIQYVISWKQVILSLICCNCTQSLQENHGIYEYLKIIHNCSLQHSSLLVTSNHPVT
jgi:hypothetical protein